MHLRKSRPVVLALFCASALTTIVSPARARSQRQDEPRIQSPKSVTVALDALDPMGDFDSAPVAETPGLDTVVVGEKPDAPAPKIATDADAAQQTSSGTNSSQQKPTGPPSNPTGRQDENPKRILGIIPNFQTKNDDPGNQPPLTVKQKYVLAFHQSVDFSAHIANLFQAGLQQASDGQPHFGQGWGPYAERFGAAEGDQASQSFFIFGLLPSVLHYDPRYFRRAKGSIWSRITYSATRTVVTRKDTGESTFNIPVVAGFLFQQSISTIYYPAQDRSVKSVFQNWGTSLAYNTAYNVLKEFYPDLLHLVFHRHDHADPSAPLPTQSDANQNPSH
jgi:hypothetical protein